VQITAQATILMIYECGGTMSEFITDPRYLAPLATCLAIIVSSILWFISFRKKQLSYEILSNTPLISVKDEVKGKVKILFEEKPVSDVHLVLLKIINSGHISIRSNDFEGRLAVLLDPSVQILMAEVAETNPKNLDWRSKGGDGPQPLIEKMENNAVFLRPVLLNKRDYIILKMLVSHFSKDIAMEGHIEGITEVNELKETSVLPAVTVNIGAVVMAIALLMVDTKSVFGIKPLPLLPCAIFFVTGYALMFYGLYMSRKQKR
jgi:hypothetical protein